MPKFKSTFLPRVYLTYILAENGQTPLRLRATTNQNDEGGQSPHAVVLKWPGRDSI